MKESAETLKDKFINYINKLKVEFNQIVNPHLATMAAFGGRPGKKTYLSFGEWWDDFIHDPVVIIYFALVFMGGVIFWIYVQEQYWDFERALKNIYINFLDKININAFTQDQLIYHLNSLKSDKVWLEKGYFIAPDGLPKIANTSEGGSPRRYDLNWYSSPWKRHVLIKQRLFAVNDAIVAITAKLHALGMSEQEIDEALKKIRETGVKNK